MKCASKRGIRLKKFIAFQILIALAIGALIGHFFPDFGMALRPVGDGFIRLIKMIVVPIVFSTIVIGAAGSGSMKRWAVSASKRLFGLK